MRNQWSHLSAAKEQWLAAVADGRAHASALVNVHLSCRNMPAMDLGVLKDMPGIRDKANSKLALREEQYSGMLLSAYKEMVCQLSYLVEASHSMRCFSKAAPNCSITQFSDRQDNLNDSGDGGGAPVFKWFSVLEFGGLIISCFYGLSHHYDLSSVGCDNDLLTHLYLRLLRALYILTFEDADQYLRQYTHSCLHVLNPHDKNILCFL